MSDLCNPSPRQVSTAGRTDGLDGALLLDECRIPLEECERLDESLALALQHLVLPPEWSLMGRKVTKNTGDCFTEMFFHFIYVEIWKSDGYVDRPCGKSARILYILIPKSIILTHMPPEK